MTQDEINFLRTSFDRIELYLERIANSLEKKQRQKKEPGVSSGAERLVELWNAFRSKEFSQVSGLSSSSTRGRNAKARWEEKPDEDYWINVIGRINQSAFCRGANERRWKADFEFLVRPDTHYRVLEGKYDSRNISISKHVALEPEYVKSLLLKPLPE